MKKHITDIYLKKKNIWDALFINVFFLILFILFFDMQYEQDDGSMAQIAYSHDEHLIFINIIIGFLLRGLLFICPVLPWYFILHLICIFSSFYVITYFLILKDHKFGTYFATLLLLTFGYNCYVSIQFTKTAVLLTTAGILLILDELYLEKVKWTHILFTFLFLLLGICYRANGFYMTFAGSLFVLLYAFFLCVKRKNLLFLRKFLAANIIIMLLCLSTKSINACFYQGPEWDYYNAYNSYRSTLLDFGFPDYDEHMELYQSLNISEEDLNLYQSWNFADTELFNLEAVKALASVQREAEQNTYTENYFNFFRIVFHGVMQFHWIAAYLITILGICFFTESPKKKKWLLIQGLTLIGLELYLYQLGRILLNRIQFGIFLFLRYGISFL